MTKVLITGGSGLVGNAISDFLLKDKHQPIWLSREDGAFKTIKKYKWDIQKNYIDEKAFEGVENIIHLAGSGILDKRWTEKYKQQIIDSRIKSNELLFNYISKNNYPIKNFVGTSAVGYYGVKHSEKIFTEQNLPEDDFLAECCRLWEDSYLPFINRGVHTSVVRTGVVLSKNGGVYAKLAPIFKLNIGAAIASGKQYFPWIHINDLARMYIYLLFNQHTHGSYNAVAEDVITNYEFSKQLSKSLNKAFFLPNIPEFILKLFIGKGSITLTTGKKISNQKTKEGGFSFEFNTLEQALKHLAC